MLNLKDQINTNRFSISLDSDEFIAILKALFWYQNKLTNQELKNGRDNYECDIVMKLRKELRVLLENEAKI
jgi:hypothetical protein